MFIIHDDVDEDDGPVVSLVAGEEQTPGTTKSGKKKQRYEPANHLMGERPPPSKKNSSSTDNGDAAGQKTDAFYQRKHRRAQKRRQKQRAKRGRPDLQQALEKNLGLSCVVEYIPLQPLRSAAESILADHIVRTVLDTRPEDALMLHPRMFSRWERHHTLVRNKDRLQLLELLEDFYLHEEDAERRQRFNEHNVSYVTSELKTMRAEQRLYKKYPGLRILELILDSMVAI